MENLQRFKQAMADTKLVKKVPTVQLQNILSPGASATLITGVSLLGGGTACRDVSRTLVILAAPSTDASPPAGEAGSTATLQLAGEVNINTGTYEQITQEVKKEREEEDKTMIIRQDNIDSNSLNMDTGTYVQTDQIVKEEEDEEEKRSIVRQDCTDSKTLNMDMGPYEQIDQEVQKEEEDNRMIDSTDSKSLIVNAGSTAKDKPRALRNSVRKRQRGEQEKEEVKDEPVNEEYDKALTPASALSQHIKDEPEDEANLKISAVFSLGGASSPNGPAAKDIPRVLNNGGRKRQRGEQERVEVTDEPIKEEYDKDPAPANALSQHDKHFLRRQILERLTSKYELALSRTTIDLDFLEFVCRQEMYLLQALFSHVDIPQEIIQGLQELLGLTRQQLDSANTAVETVTGPRGRPRFDVEKEQLAEMLQSNLSVPCTAQLMGVSTRTVFRRMAEFGLSVSQLYSPISDEQLDNVVTGIKNDMPTAGYRMVRDRLLSMGLRVHWTRMAASMHRVDSIGILSRLASLGCVVRRTYSVQRSLSLVHIDTNYKLRRYNIVIFGGIDGYSKKLMYLNASTNNSASTAFYFFLEATHRHGVPLRVRGDQGVENGKIARFMFSVHGTDRGSFISGKSVHNQRIECLWPDVRVMVTNKYYQLLHSLEQDGLLDTSTTEDLFCVHCTILPRLQADLGTFTEGWNHHPLGTEGNRSPEQMWQIGLMHPNVDQPESPEEPDVDWELAAEYNGEEASGIVVPELDSPFSPEERSELQSVLDQLDPNTPMRELYLQCREYVTRRNGS